MCVCVCVCVNYASIAFQYFLCVQENLLLTPHIYTYIYKHTYIYKLKRNRDVDKLISMYLYPFINSFVHITHKNPRQSEMHHATKQQSNAKHY